VKKFWELLQMNMATNNNTTIIRHSNNTRYKDTHLSYRDRLQAGHNTEKGWEAAAPRKIP
jgi:hypothetical protein